MNVHVRTKGGGEEGSGPASILLLIFVAFGIPCTPSSTFDEK